MMWGRAGARAGAGKEGDLPELADLLYTEAAVAFELHSAPWRQGQLKSGSGFPG